MTDRAEDPERLREAFAALAEGAEPTEPCPEPEHLWDAAQGELDSEALREVVEHIAQCAPCAEDWRLAARLGEEMPGAEKTEHAETEEETARAEPRPTSPARVVWWRFAAAAALLVGAFGLFQALERPTDRPDSAFRDGSGTAFVSEIPESATRPRDACILRWRFEGEGEGTRYQVRVTTDDLRLLAEGRDLTSPLFQVPEAALTEVPSGATLFWQVEAHLQDGRRSTSETFLVRLE